MRKYHAWENVERDLMVAQKDEETKNVAEINALLEYSRRQLQGFADAAEQTTRDNAMFNPPIPIPQGQGGLGETDVIPYHPLPEREGSDMDRCRECVEASCCLLCIGVCITACVVFCPK